MSITFQVSDVQVVRTPIAVVPARTRLLERKADLEAFACGSEHVVDGPPIHPLWLAFHVAFQEHRPVVLRPDDVWLAIAQGIAAHVAANATALRSRLVRHDGKLQIDVRRDDFVPGEANDWPGVVDELAARVREHVGGRANLFVCDFSTTGPFERTASEVVLLDAVASYFDYSVTTLCGIPEVILEGTPDDWANIRRRVRVLDELAVPGKLDVGAWARALDRVLAQIEHTARGTIDRAFWRQVYKVEDESGGDRTSGWLNAFFPFVCDEGAPPEVNRYALDPLRAQTPFDGVLLSSFPIGLTRTPFTWKVLGILHPMELWAGPFGVARDADTGAMRVSYGWAVVRG